jgi:hypothetical protein
MPLEPENERMARALHTLDQTVCRDRIDNQTASQSPDRLVVRSIDLQCFASKDSMQQCSALDPNGMASGCFFRRQLVFAGTWQLGWYVLIE